MLYLQVITCTETKEILDLIKEKLQWHKNCHDFENLET